MEDDDLLGYFGNLSLSNNNSEIMDPASLTAVIEAAVRAALAAQSEDFDRKLNVLAAQRQFVVAPQVVTYEPVTINTRVKCDEPLDVVKCIPEFNGSKDSYFSWRQAAHNAFKVYESYEGSSKFYQAVAIIRNKITGAADSNLTSYNTVLNFKAIIARLDSTYGDKRPIHLVEQEMGTLRQGQQTVQEFYDQVEKHLTLLTNKTSMSYDDNNVITTLNEKYRADALRVFISGLRRSLSDTLFSARPCNLPTALALAEELEFNRERYLFAANYSSNKKQAEEKEPESRKSPNNTNNRNNDSRPNAPFPTRNPNYTVVRPAAAANSVEPMEVDPATSTMRRAAHMSPLTGQPSGGFVRGAQGQRQRLHHLGSSSCKDGDDNYWQAAENALESDPESDCEDNINFLE